MKIIVLNKKRIQTPTVCIRYVILKSTAVMKYHKTHCYLITQSSVGGDLGHVCHMTVCRVKRMRLVESRTVMKERLIDQVSPPAGKYIIIIARLCGDHSELIITVKERITK